MVRRSSTNPGLDSSFRVSFASCLIAVLYVPSVVSAETKSPGFQDSIRDIAAARANIKSYHLTATGIVDNTKDRVTLTDGSVVAVDKKPTEFTLEYICDHENGKFLVARKNFFVLRSTGIKTTSDWLVYVKTPEWELFRQDGKDADVYPPGKLRGEKPEYFDPMALGLSFGEFHRGDPLDKIIGNYLQLRHDFPKTTLGGGKVSL